MNYAKTLDKKSIRIGDVIYTFRADRDQNSSGSPCIISIKNIQTVKEAMEQLAKFPDIDKVEVDEVAQTVTLTGSLDDHYYPVEANGTTTNYWAVDGDGEHKNSWTVKNPEGKETLNEVDGNGIANNQPVYGKDLTLSYDMSSERAD